MTRYSRQITLPQIGRAGQERIAQAHVLVLGCGALGSIQAELLARAGIGHLRIVDRDIPELSNLARQFLYTEADVSEHVPKAVAAANHLRQINSTIQIEAIVRDVTASNLEELLRGIDIVLDGVDNFETRYILNDACVKTGIPWVYGGIQGTNVLAMPIIPDFGPCLQCVFPEAPPQGTVPTCEVSGVLNTSPAITASLQVSQAIRILVQGPDAVAADVRLLTMDPWTFQVQSIRTAQQDDCPCCVQRTFPFLDAKTTSRTASLCGRKAIQVSPAHSAEWNLALLAEQLSSLGKITLRKEILEFEPEGFRLVIFPDGRVVVHGTAEPSVARSLVARFLGT